MEEPLLSQDPEKGRTLSFSSASSSSSGASSSSSLSKNNKNNKMPNTNKPKLLFTTGVRYSKQLLTFVGICFLFHGICHIYSMSNLSELKRQQYEIIARNNYLYGYNGIKNEKEGYHTNLSYHEELYLTIIQTIQDMENVNTKFLYCTITFFVVLFVFLVPKKLYVYSNPPTLVVETHCGRQYKFENIASAKRNSNQCDSFRRIRSDFSTDLQNRVYIKRRSSSSSSSDGSSSSSNKWKWSLWKDREIACSPLDPDGFLQAIEDANSMSSDSNDNCNIDT